MKIVLYNLQYQEIFANNMKSYITGKSKTPGGKYSYLFNELQNSFDEIYIYTGENYISSMNSFSLDKVVPKKAEIKFWLKINNFSSNKVKFISNLNDLNPKDTFIFGSARTLLNLKDLSELKKTKLKKVFFLSHFFYKVNEQSKLLESVGVDLLTSENNLFKNSKYFKNFFKFYKKDVYQLPFVPQKRFKVLKKFNNRKNLCIATGTWRIYKDDTFKDFLNFFKVDTLHPGRKEIGMNKEYLEGYVANFMSNDFDSDTYKKVELNENIIKKTYKRFYNVYFVKKNYFKVDIVEQYNNYKMAAVPEEVIDVPGIGFAESMACGCVFFGKNDPMYSDLGMIDGKHYVAYNGKKELKEKISYFQKNPAELERISKNSTKFAKENFNSSTVIKNFKKYLKNNLF